MHFSVLSACVFKGWEENICICLLWNVDFIQTGNSGRLLSISERRDVWIIPYPSSLESKIMLQELCSVFFMVIIAL